MNTKTRLLVLLSVLGLLAAPSHASLVFIPTTYGLSARSIALGNAMTAVGDDASMTFFNPAALALMKTSAVDLSYLYAAPSFSGGIQGAPTDITYDTANQVGLVGLSMDLSRLFKKDHGLGLGLNVGLDDNLGSFLAFEDARNDSGQFARYGVASVTMIFGLGVQIVPQVHIGGGAFIALKGENQLIAQADLAGKTKEEEIRVGADPVLAPIGGLFLPVHPIVTIGLVYRGKAVTEFTRIDAGAEALVSDSPLTTLNLVMAFKANYVPQQAALGVAVRPIPELLIAVDGTWANWDDYEKEARDSVVTDDVTFSTRDLWIPRLGLEWTAYENLFVRFGYYYEETPFDKPGWGNVAVLDNAKHAGSFGVGYDITQIPFLAHPLSLAATYFHQYLVPRTATAQDGTRYESDGNLNGFAATLSLRF